MKHSVKKTNPKSRWPYRILRVRANGSTHKLLVKFETAEKAQAYLVKHAHIIERIA